MTQFQKAREIAKTGNFDKAWEIAKNDEALLPHVTKEHWIDFVKKSIENDSNN